MPIVLPLKVAVGLTFPKKGKGHRASFEGCTGGAEIKEMIQDGLHHSRLFVSNQGFTHVWRTDAIGIERGRPDFAALKSDLNVYLSWLAWVYKKNDIGGPFLISMRFHELKRSPNTAPAFQDNGPLVADMRKLVADVGAPELADFALAILQGASSTHRWELLAGDDELATQ